MAAFALLSNHYHVILHVDRDCCNKADAKEFFRGSTSLGGQGPTEDKKDNPATRLYVLCQALTPIGLCIDSDRDGWGWNGVESCLIAAEANECDYSSAAVHNGWGWNSTTDESCPPRRLDYCDYEDTGLNEGWGWNAATRESCPPELQDG